MKLYLLKNDYLVDVGRQKNVKEAIGLAADTWNYGASKRLFDSTVDFAPDGTKPHTRDGMSVNAWEPSSGAPAYSITWTAHDSADIIESDITYNSLTFIGE